MANQQGSFLTAIDVGSAKTCALMVEVAENGLRYRGHGVAESRGSRKGVIVDLDKAVAAIQKAVESAEDTAGAAVEHAIVQNKFLRENVQDFAIRGKWNRPRPLDRLLDLIAPNLPRTRPQANAAMAVHSAHVRSADANNRVLYSRTGHILCRFRGFLNRRNRLVQLYDHALARASRLRHAVPAIAQAAVRDLYHQRARLRAAHINRRQNISLLLCHL